MVVGGATPPPQWKLYVSVLTPKSCWEALGSMEEEALTMQRSRYGQRERENDREREKILSHHEHTLCSYLTLVRMVALQKVMAPYWPVTRRLATRVTGCRPTEFSLRSQFSSSLITGTWPLLRSAHPLALAQTLGLLAYRRYKGQISKFI
jgi:hypothetical protein